MGYQRMMSLVQRPVVLAGALPILMLLVTACGGSDPTASPPPTATSAPTPVPGIEQALVETASYRIELWTGPALTSMMTSFPIMSMMDQGKPVNRHLEIHIFDKASGAKVKAVSPMVVIVNQETGTSSELAPDQATGGARGASFVTACMMSQHREVHPHFGDNLYLPAGKHTITVRIGEKTAVAEIST